MANRVKEDLLHDYLERHPSNEDLTNYLLHREVEQLGAPKALCLK